MTRLIVSPWRRSPEAVEALHRFADLVLGRLSPRSGRASSASGCVPKSRMLPRLRNATGMTAGCIE